LSVQSDGKLSNCHEHVEPNPWGQTELMNKKLEVLIRYEWRSVMDQDLIREIEVHSGGKSVVVFEPDCGCLSEKYG
jgi:hypothetical protein